MQRGNKFSRYDSIDLINFSDVTTTTVTTIKLKYFHTTLTTTRTKLNIEEEENSEPCKGRYTLDIFARVKAYTHETF